MEGACSAGGVEGDVGVAFECSGRLVLGSGWMQGLHVDLLVGCENPWEWSAWAAHFEKPAAGPGAAAGPLPG